MMRGKYNSLSIGLIFLLLLFSFSYAFTNYKTGSVIDRYYMLRGDWDGSTWMINIQSLRTVRDPSSGLLSKPEETVDIVKVLGYRPNLPAAPKEKLDWYMGKLSLGYAESLNTILSNVAKEILEKRKDTSSRVLINLIIPTADNKRVHYVASYDGKIGYRSYGFQPEVREKSIAIFAYYSKKVDTIFPQPPEGTQLIARSDIQNKLGKYDYVIYGTDGSILAMEQDVPGSESYESADESGLKNFIEDVVRPKMAKYDVDTSIIKYLYAIRPTLDSNGEYQFRVEVPYRHVSTNCPDIILDPELGPGHYDRGIDMCVVPYRQCYTYTVKDDKGNVSTRTVCYIAYAYYSAYVKTMSEIIHYEYNTEADVKIYEFKRDGSLSFMGQKTEPGVFVSFDYSKQVSPGGYSPRYFMDKIISIRKDKNYIIPYTEEPVERIGDLSID